jgi:hypothetical protein
MEKNINNFTYYWYDHLSRGYIPTVINSIEIAIKNHDYNSFLFYYNNKANGHLYTLPEISKEDFEKITYSEYECG